MKNLSYLIGGGVIEVKEVIEVSDDTLSMRNAVNCQPFVFLLFHPVVSVEIAVTNGFGNVVALHVCCTFEVGNGA